MDFLLERLGISIEHLKCLDSVFRQNSDIYIKLDGKLKDCLSTEIENISRMMYAGGKKKNELDRQMILGDIIEYIFSGRVFYYATKSQENYERFSKLIFYCVNQLLVFDTITVDPQLRKKYIEELESTITKEILYEKEGDEDLANELKESDVVIWQEEWQKYDNFVDSLLPKTLGCPKELIIFLELIRLKKGLVIPLLLTQRLFRGQYAIAPPDFLIAGNNKEIFGIEVGYAKEGQSREFSIQTSIPTFAVDLANHMHNRCPKCGKNILYCDIIIEKYSDGSIWEIIKKDNLRYLCVKNHCEQFSNGECPFSNYYGKYKGSTFYGNQKQGDDKKAMHYHANCVKDEKYQFRNGEIIIGEQHKDEFFAQVPIIEGFN